MYASCSTSTGRPKQGDSSSCRQSFFPVKTSMAVRVLVSEDNWNAMQETVYLLSVPGVRESIRLELKTPLEK